MTFSSLPGPWRWKQRDDAYWYRVHDTLHIVDGPHPEPIRVAKDDIMPKPNEEGLMDAARVMVAAVRRLRKMRVEAGLPEVAGECECRDEEGNLHLPCPYGRCLATTLNDLDRGGRGD